MQTTVMERYENHKVVVIALKQRYRNGKRMVQPVDAVMERCRISMECCLDATHRKCDGRDADGTLSERCRYLV